MSFAMSVVITLFLCGVKWLVEQTGFGEQIEEMTYGLLQRHLSSTPTQAGLLPIIVLDISAIPMVQAQGLQPGLITDRDPLATIVHSLVSMKNGPKAIGLDVDFSPGPHGYADPKDPALFDSFLTDNGRIPIRIGVNDSLALGPDKWLGDSRYKNLASCVVVPAPEKGQSTRYMPEWVDVKYSAVAYEGTTARCPALGVALANATVPDVPTGMSWFAETTNKKDAVSLSAPRFLVDYSQLETFIDSAQEIHNPRDAFTSKSVGGKIVLLGRTRNTNDTFTVPGRPEKVYAGVFLHASAAYTLLQNLPLYHLTGWGRFVLDSLFSAAIFCTLLGIRLLLLKEHKNDFTHQGLPELLSFLVTLGLVYLAISRVREYHLMWDDFILVALALVLHSPIERAAKEIDRWWSAAFHSLRRVPSPAPSSHSEAEK